MLRNEGSRSSFCCCSASVPLRAAEQQLLVRSPVLPPQKLLERAGPWLGGCSGLQPNSQLWSWRCPSASRTLTGSVLWPLPWGWACSIAEPLSGRKHFPNSNLNRPRLSFVRFLWVLSRITAETSLRAPLLALTRKLQTVLRSPLSLL